MRRAGHTPPFRGPRGEPLAGSIAEVGYRRLGGVEQWVMIRGARPDNPALIVLHGGPGMSDTGFLRTFAAALEQRFTVVYWDQRGAGKSYDPAIPRASMTVAQMLADLDELVDAVRARLGHAKVVLFGHSWGSALGALYAARFPEKVAVYVGCAQVGDAAAGEAASYAFGVAEAERRGKRRILARLRAIGAPPHTAAQLMVERTCVARLQGAMRPRELWKVARAIVGAKESSVLELPDALRGFRFSLETMWDEVSRLNMHERVPALAMPVFVMVGGRDRWIPPEVSARYLDALRAPAKELIRFEASGHEPFVDEPDAFVAAMVDRVRPVCVAQGAGARVSPVPAPARATPPPTATA